MDLVLFMLGVALTLDVVFFGVIYFFLIADNRKKKKGTLDISDIHLKENKIDRSFWG